MENLAVNLLVGISTVVVGFLGSSHYYKKRKLFDFDKKKQEAEKMLEEAKKEVKEILETAKKDADERKNTLEQENKKREQRLNKMRESLGHREGLLNKRESRNNDLKLEIATLQEALQSKQEVLKKIDRQIIEQLSVKTGQNTESLKKNVLERYAKELKEENEERIILIEEDLKENAKKNAKRILVNTIQRLSSPTSVETRAIHVKVPKDKIKGKIVGKDGQNIIEFEKQLDVDVVFNDLPNTISIACYNLVNRRIAQKAIEKLIKTRDAIDKNVITKVIKQAEKEIDEELLQLGKEAQKKLNLGKMDDELLRTVGRLKFRTSYGQNIMKHSMEVAWAATIIGSELGLDVNICRVAGFLHDLGKAIDQNPDVQGAHDFLTKELMEKYGFSEEEVHAAWTHHESEAPNSAEALCVMAADAISAGRPGARQESLAKYIERLQALEGVGKEFEGVKNAYAISAGRELRILVEPEAVKDEGVKSLAGDIAKTIEENLSYPGKIKVNVIRRTKHTEVAK